MTETNPRPLSASQIETLLVFKHTLTAQERETWRVWETSDGKFRFESRFDLFNVIKVFPLAAYTEELLAEAVTEFIGMWTIMVYPNLNGWNGWASLTYRIEDVPPKEKLDVDLQLIYQFLKTGEQIIAYKDSPLYKQLINRSDIKAVLLTERTNTRNLFGFRLK